MSGARDLAGAAGVPPRGVLSDARASRDVELFRRSRVLEEDADTARQLEQ
jgi:hypothetical protein